MKKVIILFLFCSILSAKEFTIGFSQASLSNDWLKAQLKEMKGILKNYENLQLIVKNADGKVSKQVQDIEVFTKMGVDFIIAMPLDTKITAMALKKALKKGIKIILISRIVDGENYTAFVGANNHNIAQNAAKVLVKELSSKGTILVLKGIPGVSSTKQRTAGFLDIARKYPKIKVIEKTANYQRNDAMKVMEDIYKKNIKFDAIYAQSDSMLIGAREVMKKNKSKLIPMVSIDYIKQTKQAIIDGEQLGAFVYPTSSKEGIGLIIDIINKKKVPKISYIKSKFVTKKNVQAVEPIF